MMAIEYIAEKVYYYRMFFDIKGTSLSDWVYAKEYKSICQRHKGYKLFTFLEDLFDGEKCYLTNKKQLVRYY